MACVMAFSASAEFWDGAITREIVKEAVSSSKINKKNVQQNVEAVDKPGYSLYHCTVLKRIGTPSHHAANAAVCFNNMH